MFNHFISNKLFTPWQSDFLPDLCIAQLLAITHEIWTNFDSNPPVDVRGVFLDISKPFGKVWHKGLLFKLKSSGIEGELLTLLECYLSNREQRVVSNGQTWYWRKINSGVTQGSVLGPLLFLIYINDLTEVITFICKIFAEDTSLFSNVLDTCNSENALNSDIESISSWIYQWKLQFNPDPKKQANEFIFFFVNWIHIYIHQSNSITAVSPNVLIRNPCVSSLIPNLTLHCTKNEVFR